MTFEPRWAFALKPAVGELLSGFLSRVALAHGATPYSFYALFLGSSSFWARDVDRGTVQQHDERLAVQSGLSVELLRSLTLKPWIARLTPDHHQHARSATVTPWINGSGVFHRERRQHALQFCPACLADHGIVQKAWRLSFVTVCDRHRTLLSDACPACDAPFLPHRATERQHVCHRCSHLLTVPSTASSPSGSLAWRLSPGDLDELAALQRQGLTWLDPRLELPMESTTTVDARAATATRPAILPHATASVPETTVHWHDLRHLVPVFLTGPHAHESRALLGLPPIPVPLRRQRLELARHKDRLALMQGCVRLLQEWPMSVRGLAAALGLTRRRVAHRQSHSPWLAAEVARLPSGTIRTGAVAKERFERQMEALGRYGSENWRAARAAAFLRLSRSF